MRLDKIIAESLTASQINEAVEGYINAIGGVAYRFNSGRARYEANGKVRVIAFARQGGFPAKGIPDVLGWLSDGKIFACEGKAGRDRLRFHQALFLQSVYERGGIAVISRDGIPTVERALADYDKYLHEELRPEVEARIAKGLLKGE